MFLEQQEIDRLTGILRGGGGRNKQQCQCDFLRSRGIPFFENARGEPIVARSYFEASSKSSHQTPKAWAPSVLNGGAR